MPIWTSASLASPVPWAASAARRVKRCSAMSSVCCSTAGRLGGEAQLLQRLDTDADLVRGLADGVRRRDRAVDQRAEPADRGDPDQRTTECADARAQ